MQLCRPIARAKRTRSAPPPRDDDQQDPSGSLVTAERSHSRQPELVSGVADEHNAHARTPDNCTADSLFRPQRNCGCAAVLRAARERVSSSISRPRGRKDRFADANQGSTPPLRQQLTLVGISVLCERDPPRSGTTESLSSSSQQMTGQQTDRMCEANASCSAA